MEKGEVETVNENGKWATESEKHKLPENTIMEKRGVGCVPSRLRVEERKVCTLRVQLGYEERQCR